MKINYTTRLTEQERKQIKQYALDNDMRDNEVISCALQLLFKGKS